MLSSIHKLPYSTVSGAISLKDIGGAAHKLWTRRDLSSLLTIERRQVCPQTGIHPKLTCLVWHGHLTNREELAAALACDYRVGPNRSDADLVLDAYLKWGVRSAQVLEGNFVYMVIDETKSSLICVRDPSGTRSLFFRLTDKIFYWSLHPYGVLLSDENSPKLSRPFFADYLLGRRLDDFLTAFEGVFRVPRGSIVSVSSRGVKLRRYWMEKKFRHTEMGWKEAAGRFRLLLKSAVAKLVCDQERVAILLSGGFDSSCVAWAAAELVHQGVIPRDKIVLLCSRFTFSPRMDEWRYADDVAKRCGLNLRTINSNHLWLFKETLKDVVWERADPTFSHFDAWFAALLSAARAEGATRVLTGHGGEVLTLGNSLYLCDWLTEMKIGPIAGQIHRARSLTKRSWLACFLDLMRFCGRYADNTRQRPLVSLARQVAKWSKLGHKKDWLLPWVNPEFVEVMRERQFYRVDHSNAQDLCTQATLAELFEVTDHTMWQLYLALPLGMEIACPFFDVPFLRFLLSIPGFMKRDVRGCRLVFLSALAQDLPNSVLKRRWQPAWDQHLFRSIQMERSRISRSLTHLAQTGPSIIDWAALQQAALQYPRNYLEKSGEIATSVGLALWLIEQSSVLGLCGALKSTPLRRGFSGDTFGLNL